MGQEKQVIIVGDGPAGLLAAKKLSAVPDVQTTLIAPGLTDERKELSTRLRTSTPIIARTTAERLGFDDLDSMKSVTNLQFGINEKGLIRGRIRRKLGQMVSGPLEKNPLYALDSEVFKQRLWQEVKELSEKPESRLTLINGRARIHMAEGRVAGVLIDGHDFPLTGSVVIDATGREARLIKQVQELDHEGTFINEKKEDQAGSLLGGYVEFDDPDLMQEIPTLEKGVLLGMLPGGLVGILVPTQPVPESQATHLLLIEGNSEMITKAIHDVSQHQPTLPLAEKRLAAIKLLSRGTEWESLLEKIKSIDRVIVFNHQHETYHRIKVPGLAAVGDAQGSFNPLRGTGIDYLSRDVDTLVSEIKNAENVDSAVETYKKTMDKVFEGRYKGRFSISKATFRVLKGLHKLVGV